VRELVKLVGKVKTFSISTLRLCKQCGKKVKTEVGGTIRCPQCGIMDWRQSERVWFALVSLDVIDIDVTAFFFGKSLPQLLGHFGVSWQMYKDRLKGLRGSAWFEKYKEIKNEIEFRARQHLIGQVIVSHGVMEKDKMFIVKRLGEVKRPDLPTERIRFVEGKLEELLEITQRILPDYRKHHELWEETPVIRFEKLFQNIEIEIGVRAPLIEYAKSYRVWMRVNGVHMFPAEPVRVGKESFSWVYRIYHTKGWKEKLEKLLEYLTNLEAHSLKIVEAAKKLHVEQVKDILHDLSPEIRDDILEMWHGGSIWDLVDIASKVDREAGIHILKKFGFLKET